MTFLWLIEIYKARYFPTVWLLGHFLDLSLVTSTLTNNRHLLDYNRWPNLVWKVWLQIKEDLGWMVTGSKLRDFSQQNPSVGRKFLGSNLGTGKVLTLRNRHCYLWSSAKHISWALSHLYKDLRQIFYKEGWLLSRRKVEDLTQGYSLSQTRWDTCWRKLPPYRGGPSRFSGSRIPSSPAKPTDDRRPISVGPIRWNVALKFTSSSSWTALDPGTFDLKLHRSIIIALTSKQRGE